MSSYIIKNTKTNKYIAIDNSSGGYPYETEWYNASVWSGINEAKNYKSVFSNNQFNSNDWKIFIASEPVLEPVTIPLTEKERLNRIAAIIENVDNRCQAADGDVTKTLDEITRGEVSEIYKLATEGF